MLCMAKKTSFALKQLIPEDNPKTGTKYIVRKPTKGFKVAEKLRKDVQSYQVERQELMQKISKQRSIGRSKLMERQIAQDHNRQCGLVLMEKGVLRNNQKVVIDGIEQGKITSGGYSPTLECSIGFARIPMSDFNKVSVEVRGNILEVRVVKLPFVRHNKALIDLKMLR